jgi:hypothetical protein
MCHFKDGDAMKRLTVSLVLVVALMSLSGCFSAANSSRYAPLTSTIGECSPTPCVRVSLSSLPELPSAVAPAAGAAMTADIRRALYAPLDVDTEKPSQEAIMRELQERFDETKGVTDAEIDWILNRQAAVLYSNALITSVEVMSEGYLGGAHGFKERSLMTFDNRTGARLGVSDVLGAGASSTLSKIVEAEFRRARSIRSGQTLQDAGFFILPGQEIPVGENFALTDKGMEIQYNPYEVAPYAMGETRVQIPREAVEPLLKADLRPVFAAAAPATSR